MRFAVPSAVATVATVKHAALGDGAIGRPVTPALYVHATLRERAGPSVDNVKYMVAFVLA